MREVLPRPGVAYRVLGPRTHPPPQEMFRCARGQQRPADRQLLWQQRPLRPEPGDALSLGQSRTHHVRSGRLSITECGVFWPGQGRSEGGHSHQRRSPEQASPELSPKGHGDALPDLSLRAMLSIPLPTSGGPSQQMLPGQHAGGQTAPAKCATQDRLCGGSR